MKRSLTVLLLLSVAGPLLAAIGLSSAAAAPPAQDSEFRKSYEQAMKINAVDEMGRLIRRNDHEAVLWIMETCESIAVRSNEMIEARLAALRLGWERGMETSFVDKVYTYFSLLPAQLKRERQVLRDRYEKARDRYHVNITEKDGPTFGLLAVEFRGLAGAFEKLGDHYYTSQSWVFYAICHSEEARGSNADLYEACAGYRAALAARDAIALKDRTYVDTERSFTHLAAQGYGARPGETPGEPEGGAGGAAEEAGSAIKAAMGFQLVPRLDAIERPNYHTDEFHQMWDALSFKERGSNATFSKLEQLSPSALRRGDSEVVIELDAAQGKEEIEIPMTGKLEPVRFEIGSGEERRPWAVLTTLGLQNDQYQSVQLNLAPSTGFLTVYWINAGSMVGTVAGTRVQVLDDNMDGIYGSPPRTWQNVGMTEGHFQPELDCIVIGDEKRARPWSEFTKIGETWYQLEARNGGKELACTPMEVETGFLSLDYQGQNKPSWVVVQGAGRWESSYFDLVGARGKGIEVPVGRYALFYGEMRKGRRAQMMKTLIIPGKDTQRWEVRRGEVTKVSLGAPYSFDFKFKAEGTDLVVTGRSVVVVGSAGERYERPWNAVASPEVMWREKGSRRASKAVDMPALMDTDPIYAEGYHVAWFPRDLKLAVPASTGPIEVQLQEKKHRLFGKLESGWKE